MPSKSQTEIKHHNLSLVLSIIRKEWGISRIALARKTGMSPTSMTRIVGKLERAGLVREIKSVKTGKAGRNASPVVLNRNAFYTLTIAIFKDLICVGLMDFAQELIMEKQAQPSVKMPAAQAVMNQAQGLFHQLIDDSGVQLSQVKSMGVCCTGAVDRDAMTVLFSADFMWTDIDMGGICKELFGLPLVVENDVKAALFAERTVFYKEEKDIVFLKLDNDMQAAVISGGQLQSGCLNAFGAVGHTVIQPQGHKCDCGRRGCLNTLVNERFLVNEARIFANDVMLADEVMMAYHLHLDWAVTIVEAFAKNICMALNLIICAYNPSVIVVGGRFFRRYPFLLNLTLRYSCELFYKPLSKNIEIKMASGDYTEGLAGVGMLAQEKYLRQLFESFIGD